MAGLHTTVTVKAVALVAATLKTAIQLKAGTSQKAQLRDLSIGFQSTNNPDTPVLVELWRQTSDGVGGSAVTFTPSNDAETITPRTTALSGFGTEPTLPTEPLRVWRIHPQAGVISIPLEDDEIFFSDGGRLGVTLTAAQAQTVDVTAAVVE